MAMDASLNLEGGIHFVLGQHRIIAVNNRRTTAGNKKYNASESLRFQANTT